MNGTLWLISKNKGENATIKWKRALTDRQAYLIREFFLEHKDISQEPKQEIIRLVDDAREKELWIACTCNGKFNPPVFSIRKNENGTLAIVHMANRPNHAHDCCFKERETNRRSPKRVNYERPYLKGKDLNLHRTLADIGDRKEAVREQKQNDIIYTRKRTRLANLLYELIESARLNELSLGQVDINEQYGKIRKCAEEYNLTTGIPLPDYLYTFPNQLYASFSKLRETAERWNKKVRPHAIFIVACHSIGDDIIKLKNGQEIKLFGKLSRSSGRLTENSGPYIAIFSVAEELNHPGRYNPINGYAVPICSYAHLCPVESSYERKVAYKLMDLLPWWKKRGAEVKITKPLFDIEVQPIENPNAEETAIVNFVRPDFILETKNKKIVLEVMGSYEDDYIARKERLLPLMSQIGEVIEFDALAAEINDEWDERLKKMVTKLSNLLLNN